MAAVEKVAKGDVRANPYMIDALNEIHKTPKQKEPAFT